MCGSQSLYLLASYKLQMSFVDNPTEVALLAAVVTFCFTLLIYFLNSIVKSVDELKAESKDNQKETRSIADRLTRMEIKQEDIVNRIEKTQESLDLTLREIKVYQDQNEFRFRMSASKMVEERIENNPEDSPKEQIEAQ